MADAIQILMPMEQEGSKSVVRAWLKKVGDAVKQVEPVLDVNRVVIPDDQVIARGHFLFGNVVANC